MSERLPFFVYGTLRPGQQHHAWALRGRTAAEEAASLSGLVLYEGPGYPYAVERETAVEGTVEGAAESAVDGAGVVRGDLVWPEAAHYDEVLDVLDELEDHTPGGTRNVYERVVREATRRDGAAVRAWVYVAAAPLAARLRSTGTLIAGGDWVSGRAGQA